MMKRKIQPTKKKSADKTAKTINRLNAIKPANNIVKFIALVYLFQCSIYASILTPFSCVFVGVSPFLGTNTTAWYMQKKMYSYSGNLKSYNLRTH